MHISNTRMGKSDISNKNTSHNKYVSIILNLAINRFNYYKIPYVIIRNYEEYPYNITGDIDIHVASKFVNYVDIILEKIFREQNWKIIFKSNNFTAISYQLYNPNINKIYRNVIVFEIFKGFNLIGFKYLSFNKIKKYISKFNNINVLKSPFSEILTHIHYISRAGFYPEKYQLQLENAFSSKSIKKIDFLSNLLTERLISRMSEFIYSKDKFFVNVDNIPENIRIYPKIVRFNLVKHLLWRAFIINPIPFILNIVSILIELVKRVFNPTGVVIYTQLSKASANLLLNKIKFFHLFKNSATILINSEKFSIIKILKCLHSSGAAIINIEKTKIPKLFVNNLLYDCYEINEFLKDDLITENTLNKIIDNLIKKIINKKLSYHN